MIVVCNVWTETKNFLDQIYVVLFQIHHDRKATKQQIIDQLFELVSDSEFFPVCYTVHNGILIELVFNLKQRNNSIFLVYS